ncbi:hypothetical protein [Legionella jordanis]|uniref:Transmembrane protein n=1 Tax=Legionella jordanis TaxID=456 RepID=A0A0W0V931_9GAMM|nr:hypothetical protein [Legionella jordanis]KTD16596.1 hypothetical protein Ljor_0902 [Legionella jordanis]RMX03865.1 hypothetical protein EAW55_05775 [Legionella jordanis]VEH11940.1 Uncharacterised protein [Legionella jordanis]HAT8712756.1 hypothetical protein [Legionella jordanis]
MTAETQKQRPISPRTVSAVFFAMFALLFLLFTKYTLLSLKDAALIPLLSSLLFSLILGLVLGALFGKALSKKGSWLRFFSWGLLMACLALIILSCVVFANFLLTPSSQQFHFQHWQDYLIFWGAILVTLALTIGTWLLPLTGLAALYFNKHFWPGLIAVEEQNQQKGDGDTSHE